MADSWILFDNSKKPPMAIVLKDEGDLHIIESGMYKRLSSEYGGQ
jgi:hypothetical protein